MRKRFDDEDRDMKRRIDDWMKRRDDDEDRYPYPYIFKPPKPPDDLSMAARSQLRQPPKKKDTEEKICCQYCGMELTKEDQLTHSCQKKPE